MILHVDERFKTIKTKKYNEPLFFEIMDIPGIFRNHSDIYFHQPEPFEVSEKPAGPGAEEPAEAPKEAPNVSWDFLGLWFGNAGMCH